MTNLRSSLNPEEQTNVTEGPTPYQCGPNQFRLNCEVCSGTFYVDEETFRLASTAILEGLDNPFCCEDCQEELDELAHE